MRAQFVLALIGGRDKDEHEENNNGDDDDSIIFARQKLGGCSYLVTLRCHVARRGAAWPGGFERRRARPSKLRQELLHK